MAKTRTTKTVETLKHDEATRKSIPTAEYQSVRHLARGAAPARARTPKRKLLFSANPAGIVVLMPYTVTDKGVFAVGKTVPIALPPPRPPSPLLPG